MPVRLDTSNKLSSIYIYYVQFQHATFKSSYYREQTDLCTYRNESSISKLLWFASLVSTATVRWCSTNVRCDYLETFLDTYRIKFDNGRGQTVPFVLLEEAVKGKTMPPDVRLVEKSTLLSRTISWWTVLSRGPSRLDEMEAFGLRGGCSRDCGPWSARLNLAELAESCSAAFGYLLILKKNATV